MDLALEESLENFCISQLQSAESTHQVLDEFFSVPRPDSLNILKAASGHSLGAKLCLASALATGINFVLEKRVFGNDNEKTQFKVADFYQLMLPFHFEGKTNQSAPYDQGWRVITKTSEAYYHAAIAFLKLFDLKGQALVDFPSVEWLFEQMGNKKAGIILSVNNRFTLEQLFENKGVDYSGSGPKVLLDGQYQDFDAGTHVVSVFGKEDNKVILADPFYPVKHFKSCVFKVKTKVLDSYLRQPAQGIVFSKTEFNFPSQHLRPIYIPEQVEKEIGRIRTELKLS
ncbi:MAG: hypothetical protein AB1721_02760 [Patescibacteria group bacterium]